MIIADNVKIAVRREKNKKIKEMFEKHLKFQVDCCKIKNEICFGRKFI